VWPNLAASDEQVRTKLAQLEIILDEEEEKREEALLVTLCCHCRRGSGHLVDDCPHTAPVGVAAVVLSPPREVLL
jgi:hypothetical protein